MKVTVNVDCTPEEARTFLGLPDVQPLQEAVMAQMQESMLSSLKSMEPEALLKTWGPMGMNNLEQIQKFFFSQFPSGGATGGGTKK